MFGHDRVAAAAACSDHRLVQPARRHVREYGGRRGRFAVAVALTVTMCLAAATETLSAPGPRRAVRAAKRRPPAATVWAVGDAYPGPAARRLARLVRRARPHRLLYLGDVYETGTARRVRVRLRPALRVARRTHDPDDRQSRVREPRDRVRPLLVKAARPADAELADDASRRLGHPDAQLRGPARARVRSGALASASHETDGNLPPRAHPPAALQHRLARRSAGHRASLAGAAGARSAVSLGSRPRPPAPRRPQRDPADRQRCGRTPQHPGDEAQLP